MELFQKIKAILTIAGEQLIINLRSAEFKNGTAFLHPEGDKKLTYMIKNCTADILINNGEDIPAEDVVLISKEKHKEKSEEQKKDDATEDKNPTSAVNEATPQNDLPQQNEVLPIPSKTPAAPSTQVIIQPNPLHKTKITFTVYADERDLINRMIKESGYNRTDYFIACFQNSQKKSVNKSFYAECERVKKFREHRE